jgi:predicted nucleic acid-binding protein
MAGLVVLDAGALIALMNTKDAHYDWARSVFVDTIESELVMSTLSYAETLVYPARTNRVAEFEEGVSGLEIEIHDLPAKAASEFASLRAATSLRMPDVAVLQLALSLGAEIATTDKALAAAARQRSIGVFQPQ